jgi:orotidine-5'-phosphate decarboxylase
MNNMSKLIVALDVDSFKKAKNLVDKLYPAIKTFKVGLQLFTCCGPAIIKFIRKKGARVFLDLKFFDIPNTVRNAVKQAAKLKVFMLTVHLSAGKEMLKALTDIPNRPKIVGVTVLTSQKERNTKAKVLNLAKLAKETGLDGVVCSVREAALVRKRFGKNFLIVTPGIRPKGAPAGDQKRTATAAEAVKAGSDFLVAGRPIIDAKDPLKAAQYLL